MKFRCRSPALACLLLVVAFAACVDRPAAAPVVSAEATATTRSVGLKPSSNESVFEIPASVETRGEPHAHDWWNGAASAVIHDVMYDAGLTSHCDVEIGGSIRCAAPIRLEANPDPNAAPNNIWPGTGAVEVRLTLAGPVVRPFRLVVDIPGAAEFQRTFVVENSDTTLRIDDVAEKSADLPHTFITRWVLP